MQRYFPNSGPGTFRILALSASTAAHSAAIILGYPFKRLAPAALADRVISPGILKIAENWTLINNLVIDRLPGLELDIQLPEAITPGHSYFIIANHQSWVDILILQYAFHRKTTFIRFFTKQELAYIPFLGLALYTMDFPYMKRYTREELARRPDLQGKDIETTRQSCAKIQRGPFAILNFLEGTRFTAEKHRQQDSPYRHLLRPKSGGMAFALKALGPRMRTLVDVTVCYPDGAPLFVDFWAGKVRKIVIRATLREIPAGFTHGDYENDAAFRQRFQDWVNGLWTEKDHLLTRLHEGG